MKILVTGICGFVGHALATALCYHFENLTIYGIDNLIRPGSETNRHKLRELGADVIHGDLRCSSDVESLPAVDWVIDAAANASVLAGMDLKTSSRQLVEHNLIGTINLLEYCKRVRAGIILLSTSRVYSITELAAIKVEVSARAYKPSPGQKFALGVDVNGVSEAFSTQAPVSLYGATKITSESLALEYGHAFEFPVWVNRCGVLAGAGQFGRPDQGIFSFWMHSWKQRRPLKYIGYGGLGYQVRDVFHPADLSRLLALQMKTGDDSAKSHIINVSGGVASACSLKQLSYWCEERWGPHSVTSVSENRPFDIPWMVLNSTRAKEEWNWSPHIHAHQILEEIAVHAEENPSWLDLSAPY